MKSSMHLLLIDDDIDDQHFFREAVKDIDPGITCTMVEDGATGLLFLENTDNVLPQFIFLDLRLPGLNSRTVLRSIKNNPRTTDIPVIVYTTSTEVADTDEMVKLGAAHFTTKPVNPEEIYYVLSIVLESQW